MKEYHKPVLTVIGKIVGSEIPLEDFMPPPRDSNQVHFLTDQNAHEIEDKPTGPEQSVYHCYIYLKPITE